MTTSSQPAEVGNKSNLEHVDAPHRCPKWCVINHTAEFAAYPLPADPGDVFSHDGPDLAFIEPTSLELSGVPGERVQVMPQLFFTRDGEESSRLVMVDIQRDLTPSEARRVAAALVLSAELLEATS